jgi:Flp pilus assembly protein TadG
MPGSRFVRAIRQEHGQGSIELLLLVMGILLILAGILYFGRVLYSDIAVQAAAYDGARAAVETLDGVRGPHQARTAAYAALDGWQLNPRYASVTVFYEPWNRGSRVRCLVAYRVPVGNIPGARMLFGRDPVVRGAVTLRVEQYKSRWN